MTGVSTAGTPARQFLPIDVSGLDVGRLTAWLGEMLLIREFESTLDGLSMSGKIPGGLHLSIGQEAVAVGIAAALEPQDLLACSHRSHHHALAKGLTPRSLMAELYGKATGCRGGRGGSMHLADPSVGFLGGNGVVGAGLGIAMGASLGSQMRHLDQVAVGLFGDGGANTGRTWEFVNIASVWKLPLIIVCENNMYAVETASERLTGGGSISRRAEGFGLAVDTVDGQDVAAMYRATRDARERAARSDGPTFIEARTYRYEGHSTGQIINYRSMEEVEDWRGTRDPIQRLRIALHAAGGLDDEVFDEMVLKARATVQDAIAFADESPLPDPIEATRDVTGLDLGLGNAR
jgi:TPP-dependent pyruvate/acetoin dehydrogenase alpha subunit